MLFFAPGTLWLLILSRWRETGQPMSKPTRLKSGEEEILEGRIG
jgi:hypothetical protein